VIKHTKPEGVGLGSSEAVMYLTGERQTKFQPFHAKIFHLKQYKSTLNQNIAKSPGNLTQIARSADS
jgi:hypothetical protein